MSEKPKCKKCGDTLWVCENHPDFAWERCPHCDGAGQPCECNKDAEDQPGFLEIKEIH